MPSFGLGTYTLVGGELDRVLRKSLDLGYRHIDTAPSYDNEVDIGNTFHNTFQNEQISRDELFITSKLPRTNLDEEGVEQSIDNILKDLQLDYIDLLLIHSPWSIRRLSSSDVDDGNSAAGLTSRYDSKRYFRQDLVETWRAMSKMVKRGRVRSLGVSNFSLRQIEQLNAACDERNERDVAPLSNVQLECHLYCQQRNIVDFCQANGIVVTAYSPLGAPSRPNRFQKTEQSPNTLQHPAVKEIANNHARSPAQVILAFHLQRGIIPIPKSSNSENLADNISSLNFKLSPREMSVF